MNIDGQNLLQSFPTSPFDLPDILRSGLTGLYNLNDKIVEWHGNDRYSEFLNSRAPLNQNIF